MAPPHNSDEKSPPGENQMTQPVSADPPSLSSTPNNVEMVSPASPLTASQGLDGFSGYANNNETTEEQERLHLVEILDNVNASLDQNEANVTTLLARIQATNNED